MVAGRLRFCGLICTDISVPPSTTKPDVAPSEASCAVIVAVPADWPVAIPEILTVAILVFEEDQVTYIFKFCEFPSLHVPFVLYCKVDPGARSELVGVIEIELSVAVLTVSGDVPVPLTPAKVKEALILAVPGLTPNATPILLPGVPNAAAEGLSELHCTEALMS